MAKMYVESCFACSVIIVIGIVIIFYKRKKYLSINNVSQHCTKEDPSVHGRVHYVYRWFSSILHSLFRGWENPASTYCTVRASIRSHVGDSGCMVAHKTRSKKCHTATTAFVVVVFFSSSIGVDPFETLRLLLLAQHFAPFHELFLLLLEKQCFYAGQEVVRSEAALPLNHEN